MPQITTFWNLTMASSGQRTLAIMDRPRIPRLTIMLPWMTVRTVPLVTAPSASVITPWKRESKLGPISPTMPHSLRMLHRIMPRTRARSWMALATPQRMSLIRSSIGPNITCPDPAWTGEGRMSSRAAKISMAIETVTTVFFMPRCWFRVNVLVSYCTRLSARSNYRNY